jgi:hypothetical protein
MVYNRKQNVNPKHSAQGLAVKRMTVKCARRSIRASDRIPYAEMSVTPFCRCVICWGYSVSPGLLQFPGLRITPYWRYQTTYVRTLYCTHLVSVPTYAHHHRLARP